jgi:DNA repair protein RadC
VSPDDTPRDGESPAGDVSQPAAPEYRPTIKELPEDLRPRERLAYAGAPALSTAELLAIILRTGGQGENVIRMAERLLTSFGGLAGLAQASYEELCQAHGLGPAKVTQIKAALELGRRLLLAAPQERAQIRSPADVANLLMLEMGLLEQEHMRTVLLNTKNQVIRISTVYTGSLNTAVVRIGEVFREAIRANCAGIIAVHNHPSGDPTPSPEDVRVTKMLVDAGKLLDIDVLDHLIIGRNRYVSLKERGLGFS